MIDEESLETFKNWVIRRKCEPLSGKERQRFLQTLKYRQQEVMLWITENIIALSVECSVKTNTVLEVDFNEFPNLLLEAIHEHFAEEMKAIQ